jgi:hypothetical protein
VETGLKNELFQVMGETWIPLSWFVFFAKNPSNGFFFRAAKIEAIFPFYF